MIAVPVSYFLGVKLMADSMARDDAKCVLSRFPQHQQEIKNLTREL
jgi:hypothetical protein